MYLRVKPETLSTQVTCYSAKNSNRINVEAQNKKQSVFEIGRDYVFTDDVTFNAFHKNKTQITLYLTIFNADKQDHSWRYDGDLEADNIGYINFYKEGNDSIGIEQIPAALYASSYVGNEQYELIQNNILNKIPLKEISFHFEAKSGGEEELTYGWEPDASRILWNRPEHTNNQFLVIKSVDFCFGDEFAPPDSLYEKSANSDVILLFAKEVKAIKYILLVIAIPAFGAIFKLF